MKKLLLLLVSIIFIANSVLALDVILMLNSEEIKSQILEVSSETIKYIDVESKNKEIKIIDIVDVRMIIYENGRVEKFKSSDNQSPMNDSTISGYKGNYFMVGAGFGRSYGLLGIRGQVRMGRIVGFGIHAGVGYYPGAPILASMGIKFFPYKGLYINAQYGWIAWESEGPDKHLLHGPSFLIGVDQVWGKKVGFGFNIGAGISRIVNYWNPELFSSTLIAIDLGFIVRF